MQATSVENKFLSPEFDGEITTLPFAQVLNDKRKSYSGFFITVDNLSAADWLIAPDQQFHTATWGNGEESAIFAVISAAVTDKIDISAFV